MGNYIWASQHSIWDKKTDRKIGDLMIQPNNFLFRPSGANVWKRISFNRFVELVEAEGKEIQKPLGP